MHHLVDLTITWIRHLKKGTEQENELVHTNKKHPFLTVEKGFVPVANVHIGMHVIEGDGSTGIVTNWQTISGTETMYNLTVQQDHTYTVGDGQFIVHNDNGGPQCGSDVVFPTGAVQHNYERHSNVPAYFGLPTNYNKENGEAYVEKLKTFIDSPYTYAIEGTFRGNIPVVHFWDADTDLDVIINANNNQFIGAWFLSNAQVRYLLTTGNVQ